ncbi:type IV secretion system protein [Pandoraea sp.]|uniref:type IV secretion system protein n=1 Tax=Pandoraea sp. TaxID=1883445 RepID=UPI0012055CB7|nr:type IV secretion system protein [Pandoraea sp.]TAL56908.1 MAG: hypothetical protein EPN80_01795 [Pandoraea sp.]TAM17702.1 MAG: hypothetical protein EPN65_09795 [Pandoraea sp.]
MNTQVFETFFLAMQHAGQAMYGRLVPQGYEIVGTLAFIMTAWYLLNLVLGDGFVDFASNMLNMGIKAAVVLVMLGGWTSQLQTLIVNNTESMAQTLSGGAFDAQAPLETLMSTAEIFVRSEDTKSMNKPPASTGSTLGAIASMVTSGGFWANLASLFISWLLIGLTVFFLLICAFIYMAVIQMGSFLLALAFGIGPVMVAWYVCPPMEFLFNSWLRFTIGAAFYKLIAIAMMTILAVGMPQIGILAQQYVAQSTTADFFVTNYMPALAISIMCAIAAWMMWQVPHYADGLVSGGTGGRVSGLGSGSIGKTLLRIAK